MKPLLIVAAAMCLLGGCRPTRYTGATVEMSRPGETQTIRVDEKWDHVVLKGWYQNNRGGDSSKVAGEINRK